MDACCFLRAELSRKLPGKPFNTCRTTKPSNCSSLVSDSDKTERAQGGAAKQVRQHQIPQMHGKDMVWTGGGGTPPEKKSRSRPCGPDGVQRGFPSTTCFAKSRDKTKNERGNDMTGRRAKMRISCHDNGSGRKACAWFRAFACVEGFSRQLGA